ncbi:MAG: siderophore-interacting protein [Alphaproteobacteria bacterium]|nr:siderophore-interacting protein [Alphaproteobacteria bacterium]
MLKQAVTRGAGQVFGRVVQVVQAEWLSPRIRRVRVAGPSLPDLDWTPGDKVKLHVGEGEMRSYTPARLDRARGELDLIFHVHGGGLASRWAAAAEPGVESFFFGPAASVSAAAAPHRRALLLGDETTLGLFQALAEASEVEVLGAVELAPEDTGAVAALGLPLEALPRGGAPGQALVDWLTRHAPAPEQALAWISGEATSVLLVRDALRSRGWEKAQVRVKPYWSTLGKAHRKQLERGALQS